MRIAHIITRMMIGGAQENTLYTCQDLIRDYGDEVLLITGPETGPEGDLLSRESGLKVPTLYLPSLRRNIHPLHDWQAYFAIKQALREFRPDVVHTHSAKGGMLGRLAAWSLRVPAVVHTVHGAPFHPYQGEMARGFFQSCERYAAKRCHQLVSVADAMTDLMVNTKIAPREKFVTVYSGMEVEPFETASEHRERMRATLGYRDEHVVFGKIARLFHLKGHDELIASASDVVRQNANARFLLVGDGILRPQLELQIHAAGLKKYFHFAGLVDPREIPHYLGAMDALVHTSLREGLARALPQALIAGKPVVSYDIDGAREVCISDETGYLVPPRDLAMLTEAMVRLASDNDLRTRLGKTGRERFTDQFRHTTMTRRLRELYGKLLNEK